jgi:glutathione S-transferase
MLTIYGVPFSVHTRKVIVSALHKGLAHTVVPVVPVAPGSLPPDWRQLSPTGKIPALQDGDFTLADSTAICAYLERRHPTPPIYPDGDRAFAQALWFEQYAGGTVFTTVVHPLFHELVVNPAIRKIPTDRARVDAVLTTALPEAFGYLDSMAGDGFLVGGTATVADWAVASNLVNLQYIGIPLDRARFPRLAAHFERTISTPAMLQALRDEQPVVQSMPLQSDFLRPLLG